MRRGPVVMVASGFQRPHTNAGPPGPADPVASRGTGGMVCRRLPRPRPLAGAPGGTERDATVIDVPAPYWKLPECVAGLPSLSAEAKLVWAALAYRQPEDGSAFLWPGSQKALARALGVSLRTLQRVIESKELESKGLVRIEHRHGAASRYSVLPLPDGTAAKVAAVGKGESAATLAADQRQLGGRTTAKVAAECRQDGGPITGTVTEKTTGGQTTASPSAAESATSNSHGQPPADARLLDCLEAATGHPTNGQAGKYLEAVGEARQTGATNPMIARAVLEQPAGSPPWAGPNAARDKARRLIADFDATCGFEHRPKTMPTILSYVRGCAAAEKRAAAGESLDNPGGVVSVRQWATRNRKALADAETWPAIPGRRQNEGP